MNPSATLGAYGAALALVFSAAVGVGSAVGPVGTAAPDMATHDGPGAHGDSTATSAGDSTASAAASTQELAPGGLAVSQDGYTLRLEQAVQTPGRPGPLRFAIVGPDGAPVTDFTPEHDKDLHLIVVRRDLTGFQHLHPERDARGTWSVPLTLPEAGPYKVYADFTPAGREDGLTLAADLTAPGSYRPQPLAAPSASADADGYDVSLDGTLVAGTSSKLALTVRKDGAPVTDLEPYLAAYGHLVALRDGDLAYLHVHPDGDPEDPGTAPGPEIVFYADVPSAATYRLFLDFQHAGTVRTAAFTATAEQAGSTTLPAHSDGEGADAGHDDDGH